MPRKENAWFGASQHVCPVSGIVAPPLCLYRVLPYAGGFAVYDGWRDVVESLGNTVGHATEAVAAVHRGWFERFQRRGITSHAVYCRERAAETHGLDIQRRLLQVSVAERCALCRSLRRQSDRYAYCLGPDHYHEPTQCPFSKLRYPPRCRQWLIECAGAIALYDADYDIAFERFDRLEAARERLLAIHRGWFDAYQAGGERHE